VEGSTTSSIVDRLRDAQEALEESGDLLDAIYSGEVHVVRECTVHDDHRGFLPVVEVTYVEFQDHLHGRRADLKCGHSVWIPKEMLTSRGEMEPCAYCALDCDWAANSPVT
jgi:hypothetical protein